MAVFIRNEVDRLSVWNDVVVDRVKFSKENCVRNLFHLHEISMDYFVYLTLFSIFLNIFLNLVRFQFVTVCFTNNGILIVFYLKLTPLNGFIHFLILRFILPFGY